MTRSAALERAINAEVSSQWVAGRELREIANSFLPWWKRFSYVGFYSAMAKRTDVEFIDRQDEYGKLRFFRRK